MDGACQSKHPCDTAAEVLVTASDASHNSPRTSHGAGASQFPTESSACKTLRPGQHQQQEDLRLKDFACQLPELPVSSLGTGLDGSVCEPADLHPRPWKQTQHSSQHRVKLLRALPQLVRPVRGGRSAAAGQQPPEPGRPQALGSSRALRAVAQAHKQRLNLASAAEQTYEAVAAAAFGATARPSTCGSKEEQPAGREPAQSSAGSLATGLPLLPCEAALPATQQRALKGSKGSAGASEECSPGVDESLAGGRNRPPDACEGSGLGLFPQDPGKRGISKLHLSWWQMSPPCQAAGSQERQQQQGHEPKQQETWEQQCGRSGQQHARAERQSGLPGRQLERLLQLDISSNPLLARAQRLQQPGITELLVPGHPAQGAAAPAVPDYPLAFLSPCEPVASAALQPQETWVTDCAPPGPPVQPRSTAAEGCEAMPRPGHMPVPAQQEPAPGATRAQSALAVALSTEAAAAATAPAEVPTALAVKEEPVHLPEGRQLRKRKQRHGTEELSGQVPVTRRRMAAASGSSDQRHQQQALAPALPPWAAQRKEATVNITGLVQAAAARQPLHPWLAGWLPGTAAGRLRCTKDGSSSSSSSHDGGTKSIRPKRPLPGWLAYQEAAFSPAFHACDSPESLQALVAATSAAVHAHQPGLSPALVSPPQPGSRLLEGEEPSHEAAAPVVGAGQPGISKFEPRLALPEAFARLLAALLGEGAELEALAPALASARRARGGLVPPGLPPRPRKATVKRAK
ncbi:hypothetical protein N2152v2_003861 [Parachlorella kessleri]